MNQRYGWSSFDAKGPSPQTVGTMNLTTGMKLKLACRLSVSGDGCAELGKGKIARRDGQDLPPVS